MINNHYSDKGTYASEFNMVQNGVLLDNNGNPAIPSQVISTNKVKSSNTELLKIVLSNQTITSGRTLVVHNLNAKTQVVSIVSSDTTNVIFTWQRTDGGTDCDELNKVLIWSNGNYSNVEITILAF